MNPSNIKKIAEKNFQERRELNPVLLGEKQKCNLCAAQRSIKIFCPDFSDYRKGAENAKSSPEIIECGFNMKPGEGQICKVNAKDLMNNATYTDPEVVQANFRDPNFNDSLCYEKLSESEAHAFLHYETGWSLVLA